jgi:hypothetical protein
MSHHYAVVAAKLVEQCLDQIQSVIDADERSKRLHSDNSSLYDMKVALAEIESHLFNYFSCIIEKEVESSTSSQVHERYQIIDTWSCDLKSQVEFLQFILMEANIAATAHAGHPAHSYYPRRSTTDSLLFRLNVALQLCLVRIDDARFVICGERYQQQQRETTFASNSNRPYFYGTVAGFLGATAFASTYVRQYQIPIFHYTGKNFGMYQPLIMNASKVLVSVLTLRWIHTKWSNKWMTTKLVKSTEEIEEWIRQWILVQSTPTPKLPNVNSTLPAGAPHPSQQQLHQLPTNTNSTRDDTTFNNSSTGDSCNSLDAARSRRLIEYAMHETAKVRNMGRCDNMFGQCFDNLLCIKIFSLSLTFPR